MVPLLPGLSRSPSRLPTTAVVHNPPPLWGARMAPVPGHQHWSYWKRKVLVDKQTPGLPRGEQPKTGLSWISSTAPPAQSWLPQPVLAALWVPWRGGRSQPAGAAPRWFELPRAVLYPPPRVSAAGSVWDPPNLDAPASCGSAPQAPSRSPGSARLRLIREINPPQSLDLPGRSWMGLSEAS